MKQMLVNDQIKSPAVILIMPDGRKFGKTGISEARKKAEELGMDLIQVANGKVPICKILDYGKMKYRESKKKQHSPANTLKEIRIKTYKISDNDLERKIKQAIDFLNSKKKVQFSIRIKGADNRVRQEVRNKFNNILQRFTDVANWGNVDESKNNIGITLHPKS
jgi:translation initiation factor IF-3